MNDYIIIKGWTEILKLLLIQKFKLNFMSVLNISTNQQEKKCFELSIIALKQKLRCKQKHEKLA